METDAGPLESGYESYTNSATPSISISRSSTEIAQHKLDSSDSNEETCLKEVPIENINSTSTNECSKTEPNEAPDDYTHYLEYMPSHLSNHLIDVLIIFAKKDRDDAETFRDHIMSLSHTAELLDCSLVQSKEIEDLYKRSMLYFLYVTEAFCSCQETLLKSHIILSQTLDDVANSFRVVPVYACTEKKIDLSLVLKYLNPIRYYRQDKDKRTATNILNNVKYDIAGREIELEKKRETYYNEHKSELRSRLRNNVTKKRSIQNTQCKNIASSDGARNISKTSGLEKQETHFHSDNTEQRPSGSRLENSSSIHQTSNESGYVQHDRVTDDKKSLPLDGHPKIYKVYNINISKVKNLTIEDNSSDKKVEDSELDTELSTIVLSRSSGDLERTSSSSADFKPPVAVQESPLSDDTEPKQYV
ncbi:hypothetical protein BgiBS90_024430 [Biomphalaria glabrata]|nr:hypothetical protein BgiBS90_024430 [Biomphalaria glabrata]